MPQSAPADGSVRCFWKFLSHGAKIRQLVFVYKKGMPKEEPMKTRIVGLKMFSRQVDAMY